MTDKPAICILATNKLLRSMLTDFFASRAEITDAPDARVELVILDAEPDKNFESELHQWQEKLARTVPFLLLADKKIEWKNAPPMLAEVVYKPLKLQEIAHAWETLRQRMAVAGQPPLTLGSAVFNSAERALTCGGKAVILTQKEAEILILLEKTRGHMVPADTMLREVWGVGEGINTHTLQTHISRLRAKIRPIAPEIHISAPGSGYQLDIAE